MHRLSFATAARHEQLAARAAWMRELIANGQGGTDAAQPARGRPLFVWATSLAGPASDAPAKEATAECPADAAVTIQIKEKEASNNNNEGGDAGLTAADVVLDAAPAGGAPEAAVA